MNGLRGHRAVGLGAVVAALAAALVLPAGAGAVLPGFNGKILFVSGRDGTDATARVYFKDAIGSQGGGNILGPIAAIGGSQLRHPSWAPDRTKIAFAAGGASCNSAPTVNKCKIFTLDVTNPTAVPVRLTASVAATNEDRPAWSPDGTKIAFEQESGTTNSEIIVKELAGGIETNVTGPDPQLNLKPAWSPDSQFLFYSSGDPFTALANTARILRKPTSNLTGAFTTVVSVSGASQWQPSISPDGTKMCFTIQGASPASADVVTVPINGLLPVAPGVDDFIATQAAIGEYNCTWSPDGTKIAYVEGIFGTGNLVQQSYPKDVNSLRTLADSPQFDGNPDWAPDARPTCPNKTVSVPFNTATTIPLSCADQGPAYEQTDVLESIRDDPTKGTVGDVTQGTPSTVTYAPNTGFTGTDTFNYIGRDTRAFGTFGTVTINVQPDTTKPDITALRVRPSKIKRGKATMKLGVNTGRRITFTLSEDAAVTLKFEKRTTGRRVGGKCRKKTNANKGRKKCTRYVSAGSRKFTATKQGNNSIRFQGRIRGSKRLALGRYRLSATARDAANNPQQQTRRKAFRLVQK